MKGWPLLMLFFPLAALAQVPDTSDQLIVVTTKNWTDTQGTAQRYERQGGSFKKYQAPFAVVIGKNGMAWGQGLVPVEPGADPVKREGDGKAPAGVFKLGTAFGYDSRAETKMPYLAASPTVECVDDSTSSHYNTLVDTTTVQKDWSSAEQMRRNDDLYRKGIFIQHNTPATATAGSCIFFHIWRNPTSPTLGCTAMDPASLSGLLTWLDPQQAPLLVQMPEAQYEHYRQQWHLPAR
ncbi:MAG: hypothetical protein PW845_20820 [Pseudomonas sp.]|uniref:L,D-transpeptidase family protein n=1 Tax=Pseudomonas abieticivorans TaxID=2931382 RepID=UPI0020BE926F|nr:hypothetical protein [Pseudomonas sp. PIA16]MDE1167746.1 hypothetical protein [Pseudomonas sp.]